MHSVSPSRDLSHPGRRAPDEVAGQIVGLGRRCSRLQFELCHLLAEYDVSGHWALSGAVTCSRWAADALEVETSTAREWLRVGHALGELPDIARAFADGELSYAKVRTLTRVAVDHPDRQDELVDLARGCTASALSHELARWTATEEDPEERDRRHRRETSLSARTEPDGAAVITIRLPPLDGAAVMAAIDAEVMSNRKPHGAARHDRGGSAGAPADVSPPRSVTRRPGLGQQRATAFVHLLTHGGAGVATELLVHIRDDGATLTDGTPVAEHLLARLAPTSFFRALVHDAQRRPINASSRQRHPTTRQKLVVAERDGYMCTRPGCNGTKFLQYDHNPDYEITHRTVVDELFLRCGNHHRDRHRRE